MKTVQKKIVGIELYCPSCESIIASPSGSHIWDVNELTISVKCAACGINSLLPPGLISTSSPRR